ncbi:hypothetical protein [Actinocorallia libanotica]|uniref:Uncharacterized protein n=1 Tax=Actinocorallia libanotica TaxID=46162 RepID=A0ABN1RVJ8_9ACTN
MVGSGDTDGAPWRRARPLPVDLLVRTAWTVNDLPHPSLDLGTFPRHLDDLAIPPDAPARLRQILRAPAATALRLQLDLLDRLEPHLGARREDC